MDGGALFFIILGLNIAIATRVGLYKLFEKAGEAGWKALIPVYSDYIWLKLSGRPIWWVALLLLPIVSTLVRITIRIDLVKSYGKYDFGQQALAVIFPFIYFPMIGFKEETEYLGPFQTHKKLPKKSAVREWADAFLFAGVAALIIRTFFIEAFMIPTSSMERTLLAGDFLFVSKFHYGPRMPMIPMAVPFVHNKIKLGGVKVPSYVPAVQFPYWRAPGLTKIKRNDIVVFNYPAHDIHNLNNDGTVREISMKENYIKRCVGLPGDKLEIRRGILYVNDEQGYMPPDMQYSYEVTTNGQGPLKTVKDLKKLGFRHPPFEKGSNQPVNNFNYLQRNTNLFWFWSTGEVLEELKNSPNYVSSDTLLSVDGNNDIFPKNSKVFKYDRDMFGPITIPAEGKTVELTPRNYRLYERVIEAYEGHKLEKQGTTFKIDGKVATSYTFEMDYYFMMGDNRHNSEDSRYWGFVPENHIVGKPLIVFFSMEKGFGIRFNRIGTKYVH